MINFTRNIKNLDEMFLSFKRCQNGCDIELVVHEDRILVHSLVLAVNSEFFRINLFSTPLVPREIILNDIDFKIARRIVDYFYTGNMILEQLDMLDLLNGIDNLLVETLLDEFVEFSKVTITAENYFQLWKLARKFKSEDLRQNVIQFITEHFNEMLLSDSFLNLDLTELVTILSIEVKNRSEENVLNFIAKWISRDFKTRSKDVVVILENMKLCCVDIKMLKSKLESLCIHNKCSDLFLEAMDEKCELLPISEAKTIIVLGGYGITESNIVEKYEVEMKVWTKTEVNFNRKTFESVFFDDKLFVIGGADVNGKAVSAVEAFNLKTWTKRQLSPLKRARYHFAAVNVDNHVYAIGGYGNGVLASIERYNPATNTWIELNPMPTQRGYHKAAVIEGEIFVIGGYNGIRLAINECFSITTRKWRTCAPMQIIRDNVAVAAVNGFLYAVAGDEGLDVFSSVEKYDPKVDKWIFVKSISSPRRGIAAVNYEENLLISGGEESLMVATVEQFDPLLDQWNHLQPLHVPRSFHNMVVVPRKLLY